MIMADSDGKECLRKFEYCGKCLVLVTGDVTACNWLINWKHLQKFPEHLNGLGLVQ